MKTETPSSRSSRRSAGIQSILNLFLVAFILVAINYLGAKYYKHIDLSASQYYTLSPKTIDILHKLDGTLTIYTSLDLRSEVQAEQITTLLKEYQRIGGDKVVLEKIDPDFNPTRAEELYKKLHFDGNDHLVIFELKDREPRFVKEEDLYEVNPMTGRPGAFKGEQQLTAALLALEEGKISKVYFTEGHGEHPYQDTTTPTGYGLIGQLLKNENVETSTLNLAKKGEVPADADAVVIAGPSVTFAPVELDALANYLAKNGKLFMLLDPYTQSGLDDLLKKYDLKFEDDLVLYRSGNIVTSANTVETLPLAYIYQGGFSPHPITAKLAQSNVQLLIKVARSITFLPDPTAGSTPKTQFLLQTDPDAWGWRNSGKPLPDDMSQITFNQATDLPGPVTVAAEYDGGTMTDPATKATVSSTRLVLVGCSKFLENDAADQVGANFFTNAIDWLVKKDAVLDISPKKPQDYGVTLNPISARTLTWLSLLFFPGAALLLGVFTWFSRRK